MSFTNLPQELKSIPQWVVYRSVIRGEEIAKPPYRLDDPTREAKWSEPDGWGTFEQAVWVYEANQSVLSGIGFMLTEADPYVVIDVDKIEKVPADMLGYRREFEKQVLALATYTEYSPSNRGMHAWIRGHMHVGGRHLKGVGSEVYAYQRFITCTGRPVSGECAGGIVDGQDFLHMVGLGEKPPEVVLNDDETKPLGLADAQVLQAAYGYVSWFGDRYEGWDGCLAGEWSHTFYSLVGVLEKLTGSPAQVYRLMQASPMVAQGSPAASGETRPAKCKRTFADVFAQVRGGNRSRSYFVDHGRQVYEAMERYRAEQAAEQARAAERLVEQMREAEETARRDGQIDMRGSTSAADVLARFKALGGDPLRLTVPPGRMGELVMASMRANPVPYLKYALPAALSTVSGIVARAYAPDRGGPLNMNYILVAPSSTGKTVSMDVWEDFLAEANLSLPSVIKPVDRLVKNGTMSVQGIWPVFEEAPSCAWFIEEASAQFNGMSKPKSGTDENMRNLYNELFDSGKHSKVSSLPRSVASKNAGLQGIRKLCVSTYWTTTPDKFALQDSDIKDGFASRVVFVHHDQPGGAKSRYFDRVLPDHLRDLLRDLLVQAATVDRAYDGNPQAALGITIKVDTTAVDDAWWDLDVVCDLINREAITGKLPKVYQMLSRVPMNTRRMACALAIVENPWSPRVTLEQLTWCHNYLMHNAIGILAAMDSGEVGDNVSDEVLAAKRVWVELVKKGAMKGLPGVPQSKLLQAMASHAPFRTHRNGRTKSAADCIKLMVDQQLMHEAQGLAPTRGRPARYLLLCDELAA